MAIVTAMQAHRGRRDRAGLYILHPLRMDGPGANRREARPAGVNAPLTFLSGEPEMTFRSKWIAAPVLLLAALAGCEGLGDDDSFQLQKLAQARTQWDSKNVASYSYIVELECFCAPASELEPVLVTVRNGAVASLEYWDENPAKRTPAPAAIFGPYDTVEELFDLVEDAIDRDADMLQVGYDPEYGFPQIINVDYQAGGSEQKLLFITEFEPSTTP